MHYLDFFQMVPGPPPYGTEHKRARMKHQQIQGDCGPLSPNTLVSMHLPAPFLPRDISWSDLTPQRGHDLESEIKCYSLPFGGLGFTSHFLTYYALVCLWFGRRPLWPFRKLSYGNLDIALGSIGLVLSTGISIYAMTKCKNTWQLLVIALWKMSMSVLNGITAVHAAWVIKKNEGKSTEGTARSMWWILAYVPGMFAGMSGLMDLVVEVLPYDKGIVKLTGAFFGLVGIGVLNFLGNVIKKRCDDNDEVQLFQQLMSCLMNCLVTFTILAAFYGDWALGMMTDNLVGLPSGDNAAFYWAYFLAKRLTLLSA